MGSQIDDKWVFAPKVRYLMEPSVLMKIYRMSRQLYPNTYSGSLLGLIVKDEEKQEVSVEVTDLICSDDRNAVINLANYVGNDCEVVGLFKPIDGTSSTSDMSSIMALRKASKKNKYTPHIIITCDLLAGNSDDLNDCFQSFRLGPNDEKPLIPVKLEMNDTVLQKAFCFEWALQNDVVWDIFNCNLGSLKDRSYGKRKMNTLYRGLDDIVSEQDHVLKLLKDKERHTQRVNEWMEKRRLENQNRYLHDQEPLPQTRAAALQAVGEAPPAMNDLCVKSVATVQPLLRASKDLANEQKEDIKRQRIVSSAF